MRHVVKVVCFSVLLISTENSISWSRQAGGESEGTSLGGEAPAKRSLDDIRDQLKQKQRPSSGMGMSSGGGGGMGMGGGPGMDGMGSGPGMSGPGMGGGMGGGPGMGMDGGMGMGPGGGMGGGGPAMGMGSGMGMGSPGGGMGGPEPTDKQLLAQLIQELRSRLSSKKYKREKVEKQLRAALEQYFNADLEERVREFDKIRARVNEMESKLQRRLDSEQDIVELQLKQMLHKADGLDFSIPDSNRGGEGYGGMGMGGMSGEGVGGDGVSYGGEGGMGMGGMSGMGGMGEGMGAGMDGGEGMGGMGMSGGYGGSNDSALNIGYDSEFAMTRFQRLDSSELDDSDPLKNYSQVNSPLRSATNDEEKLKSITLAFHQFEFRFKHLPRSVNRHAKSQPTHSWRVAILPLIGEGRLYEEYQFDEPWNSKANLQVAAKMPALFSTDEQKTPNTTQFKMLVGGGSFDSSRTPPTFGSITDGTSNTLMIVQSNSGVPWTKPEDISYSPNGPLPALSKTRLVGLADGNALFLPMVDDRTFRAMITRDAGETIAMPQ